MTDQYTRPLAGSAALVLIDVQRGFYAEDAPLRINGTSAAIPAMARLAMGFRERALPIVHVDDRGIEECRRIGVDVRELSATLAWLRRG